MGPPGTLDKTFGSNGILSEPVAGHGEAIAIQPDGKLVIAGWATANGRSKYMVTRYLTDGAVDTSFAGGMQILDDSLQFTPVLAIQPDGKIVIAETTGGRTPQPVIVRLNIDGSFDGGFGVEGRESFDLSDPGAQQSTIVYAVAVLSDGHIVVAGRADATLNGSVTNQAVIAQFTSAGALDPNFGTNGRTFTALGHQSATFRSLALQSGGRLLAAGLAGPDNVLAFARFGPTGDLDSSFFGGGFFDFGYSTTTIATITTSDGKVVAAGGAAATTSDEYFVRLDGDTGSPDGDFGGGSGIYRPMLEGANLITSIALQTDGQYVVAGNGPSSPFIARLHPNQLPDYHFGNGGVVTPTIEGTMNQFRAIAMDADGRIVITGFRDTGLNTPDEFLLYRFWL